jgi:hypothetical protein
VFEFIRTYPYLLWSLATAAVLGLGVALSPAYNRTRTMLCGTLAFPFAIPAIFFGQAYWNPRRIIGILPSLEDVLYTVAAAGITWLLSTWMIHRRMSVNIKARTLLFRYLFIFVSGAPFAFGSLWLEISPMSRLLLPIAMMGIVLLWLKPKLWIVAAWGCVGFAVYHILLLVTAFAVTPSFAESWYAASLWGPRLWGVPLDEIAWAAAFGALCPLFAAYVLDAQVMASARQIQTESDPRIPALF